MAALDCMKELAATLSVMGDAIAVRISFATCIASSA
jgi:hypothetical protein